MFQPSLLASSFILAQLAPSGHGAPTGLPTPTGTPTTNASSTHPAWLHDMARGADASASGAPWATPAPDPADRSSARRVRSDAGTAGSSQFAHRVGHYLGLLRAGAPGAAARYRNETMAEFGTTTALRFTLDHRLGQAALYYESIAFLESRCIAGARDPGLGPFIREVIDDLYHRGTAALVNGHWPADQLGTTEYVLDRARRIEAAEDDRQIPQIDAFYEEVLRNATLVDGVPPQSGPLQGPACSMRAGSITFTGPDGRSNAMRFGSRPLQDPAPLLPGAPLKFPVDSSAGAQPDGAAPPPRLRPANPAEKAAADAASRAGTRLGRNAGRQKAKDGGPATGMRNRMDLGARAGARAGGRASVQAALARLRAGAPLHEALEAGCAAAVRAGAWAGQRSIETSEPGVELQWQIRYTNPGFRQPYFERTNMPWEPPLGPTTLLLLARDPAGQRPDLYSENGGYTWTPTGDRSTTAQEARKLGWIERLRNITAPFCPEPTVPPP